MSALTVSEMLKYANLQVAAEALYDFKAKEDPNAAPGSLLSDVVGHYKGVIRPDVLTDGNEHATRFTSKEAADFAAQWEVVDHISNTTTGFSGTLFRALKSDPSQGITAGQLVLSFRSTEFIDDAARDCLATNSMEIKNTGWAWGQISDMEAWYATLKNTGLIPAGVKPDVTGYSLAGHLATAFNLLHQNELNRVVTFNGAGVGKTINGKTPASVIADFIAMREHPDQIALKFTNPALRDAYNALRLSLADGHKPTAADFTLLGNIALPLGATEYQLQIFNAEKKLLQTALDNLVTLKEGVVYLNGVKDIKDGGPAAIPDQHIAQESFTYQMAVQWAATNTVALSTPAGAWNMFFGKDYGTPLRDNQYDIVGRETTTKQTAMVSDSQWHHGINPDFPFTPPCSRSLKRWRSEGRSRLASRRFWPDSTVPRTTVLAA